MYNGAPWEKDVLSIQNCSRNSSRIRMFLDCFWIYNRRIFHRYTFKKQMILLVCYFLENWQARRVKKDWGQKNIHRHKTNQNPGSGNHERVFTPLWKLMYEACLVRRREIQEVCFSQTMLNDTNYWIRHVRHYTEDKQRHQSPVLAQLILECKVKYLNLPAKRMNMAADNITAFTIVKRTPAIVWMLF